MKLRDSFGKWTVIDLANKRRPICRCECGTEKPIFSANLTSGRSTSCGCSRAIDKSSIAKGSTVGSWKILSDETAERHVKVRCLLCGAVKSVYFYSLLNGDSTSCGCHRKTGPRARLHWMWSWMHSRCYNAADPMYRYYGARGITVCAEWNSFDAYFDWAVKAGFKKSSGLQIDRRNNDLGYSPENCRVVTVIENANNKSNNILLTAFGETMTLGQWAADDRCAVSYATLWARAKSGTFSPEETVTLPAVKGRRRSHKVT